METLNTTKKFITPHTFWTKNDFSITLRTYNNTRQGKSILTRLLSPLITTESRVSLDGRKCFTLCQRNRTSSKQPLPRICSAMRFNQTSQGKRSSSRLTPSSRSISMARTALNSRMNSLTCTVRSSNNREASSQLHSRSTMACDDHNGKHCLEASASFHMLVPEK